MFTRPNELTAIVQRPRLIALDLDGTLLPESKQLTARSHAALRAMEELGTTVSLATGKFLHLAERYGEELGLRTPMVALDGARLGGGGRAVIENCIARDTAEEILERRSEERRVGKEWRCRWAQEHEQRSRE